ncbi:hypothetical protein Hypma_002065 [Hypsizygus marmoreus]|uniref:Uncharacterized protein n=1 Tax=Hypsizygus marmoreus TaxID=39966 RepID=A0A369J4Q0_HYPMA|nr:hypothetical protein Hypma_002065 [Hypsizygus marmoreus]
MQYSPAVPWDVSIGDLGYVQDDKFIRLSSVLGEYFTVSADEKLVAGCDPDHPFSVEIVSDDWVRYTFERPMYVSIRHHTREAIDATSALRHLLKHCSKYLKDYASLHPLNSSDLILITNKDTARRSGTFEYCHGDHPENMPPEKVYYFERRVFDAKTLWGYWSIEPEVVEDQNSEVQTSNLVDPHMVATTVLYPQMIEFVQLEQEDVLESCDGSINGQS